MRCFVAEAFSGSVIETVGHEGDVLDGDAIEGHFLWKELANEAVHGPRPPRIFVGTTFPGGVGCAK